MVTSSGRSITWNEKTDFFKNRHLCDGEALQLLVKSQTGCSVTKSVLSALLMHCACSDACYIHHPSHPSYFLGSITNCEVVEGLTLLSVRLVGSLSAELRSVLFRHWELRPTSPVMWTLNANGCSARLSSEPLAIHVVSVVFHVHKFGSVECLVTSIMTVISTRGNSGNFPQFLSLHFRFGLLLYPVCTNNCHSTIPT
jgi:hypothetical protein